MTATREAILIALSDLIDSCNIYEEFKSEFSKWLTHAKVKSSSEIKLETRKELLDKIETRFHSMLDNFADEWKEFCAGEGK